VFQPLYHQDGTPNERDRVVDVINRYRPAGSLVVKAASQPPAGFAARNFVVDQSAHVTAVYNFGLTHYRSGFLSSSARLSDYWGDLGSHFLWREFGNRVLTFGCDTSLGLFMFPTTWERVRWGSFAWVQGSPGKMVVTQY
jgi:hypothetical protein